MRLGVSSFAFPRMIAAGEMDIDALVGWAQAHGLDAVQFCENLPWPLDRGEPDGLFVELGCRGIGPHLLDYLDFMMLEGDEFVRLVIDDGDDRPTAEEAIERLTPYAEAYNRLGIVLAIENHDRFPAQTLRRIVETLGLGVVLDTANSLGSLEDLDTVVDVLGPYVVNLHAKDVRAVRKPDALGFEIEGTPFGEGEIEWTSLLRRLPRLQSVTLEQWAPREREREWAALGVGRLRQWIRNEESLFLRGEPARPEPIVVRTSTLTAEFEPDSGWLRYVKRGEDERVRAIYGAARTPDWGTPPPTVTEVEVRQTEEGFTITYAATVEPVLPLRWRVRIVGEADRITFEFDGEAVAVAETNRFGLCLLHALTYQGLACTIVHPNDSREASEFPDFLIAPHQPFRDVRAIEAPGLIATFAGGTFETEDQRNWSDASFKTYSRPLDWPHPYRLEEGEKVRQSVTLDFSEATFEPQWETFPMGGKLPSVGILGLRDAPVSHFAIPERNTLRLRNRRGRTLARPDLFTPTNFAEQNRDHPKWVKEAMFALNPQVHASDWRTVVESLEGVHDALLTATGWAQEVHLGPVRLDPRGVDPRIESLAAAGWLLGIVTVVAEVHDGGRAPSVTFDLPDPLPLPIVHVLADLLEFAGGVGEPVIFPHPQDRVVLGVDLDGRRADLVANLTDRPVRDTNLPKGRLRLLDRSSLHFATTDPAGWRATSRPFSGGDLILPPYAYARVDAEGP